MLNKLTRLLAVTCCTAPLMASAQTTHKPTQTDKRWELGVGLGGIVAPDYRGSKTYRSYVAPIPYVVYHGPVFRTDRNGLQGDFLRTKKIELNLSAAASITPDSDKNTRRAGMPALESTLEIGPAININLTGASFADGWSATVPVRAVVTLGGGAPEYIGLLSAPAIIYRAKLKGGWKASVRGGPVFASGRYHDYYYAVKPQYALANRPAYQTTGGYNGFNTQLAVSRRVDSVWYAFYLRYSNIQGTSFSASPLVETQHNYTAGFAVSWVLF